MQQTYISFERIRQTPCFFLFLFFIFALWQKENSFLFSFGEVIWSTTDETLRKMAPQY